MAFYIGIVGTGNISRTHLRAAAELEDVKTAAIYGPRTEEAEELAREFGATAYADWNSFLDHRPMDFVALGSPSGLHARQGIDAAGRGLHVLTEKPIDITVERAGALVQACRQQDRKLGVFFQDRVKTDTLRLRSWIQKGLLGNISLVSAQVRWYRPPEYYAQSDWRGTVAMDGGGALMNQGVHTVDLMLWLLGPVRRVMALTATQLHRIEVEDTVAALLEFESGALGTLEASTAAFPGYPRRLAISGSEGTVILEHDRLTSVDLRTLPEDGRLEGKGDSNQSASSAVVSDTSGHRLLLENFVQAMQGKAALCCSGQEALSSVALVRAVYESARSGGWVQPAG